MKKLLPIGLLMALPLFTWAQFNVTFRVDMNDYTGSATTPEVNGLFNGWCGNCAAMTDANNDGIWEIVISLPAGPTEYKFSADNWGDQESLLPGSPCTVTNSGFTNRSLNVTGDVVLPAVCWGSCGPCSGTPSSGNVTFRVDMSTYTGPAFSQVNLNGTFNNWCGSCAVMTDPDGDMIYELPVTLPLDTIQWKFTLDGWTVDEQFSPGDPCTFTDGSFTNRTFIVTGDTTLPAYCWESCQACGGTPSTADVTFRVDMSNYSGAAFNEVNLNGTFNNWCGSCAVMTDPDGDMIYELQVTVPMDSIEYKFTLDGWTVDEQFTPGGTCTYTDGQFTNRLHVVTMDETLPAVCWESCDPCTSIGVDTWNAGEIRAYPNPGTDYLTLDLAAMSGQEVHIQVMDLSGRLLLDQVNNSGKAQIQLNASAWSSGVYVIRVVADQAQQELRWIKR